MAVVPLRVRDMRYKKLLLTDNSIIPMRNMHYDRKVCEMQTVSGKHFWVSTKLDKWRKIFMKATGIVRRIDDLGRVVIPKEIRRTLRIKEGDPLEIFTDREGEVILKKYSPIGELGKFAREYAESLAQTTGHSVCITDRDQVVAAAGGLKKDYLGKPISGALETMINERESTLAGMAEGAYIRLTKDDTESRAEQVIAPILCEGDAIGSVILMNRGSGVKMGETENALAKCAAGFMGRQMEQ